MLKGFAAVLVCAAGLFWAGPASCADITTWLCLYSTDFGPEEYGRFDLVVLDGVNHPSLEHRSPGQPVLLGYVSVGEEREDGPVWDLVQDQPFVAGRNDDWNSLVLDLRSPAWRGILLDRVIPEVLAQGFDGVFLDTMDSALALAHGEDKAKYQGMREAALSFLAEVRRRWPGIHIALNRGLELLPEAAPGLDSLLIEDLSFGYDFSEKAYRPVPSAVRDELVAAAHAARAANPKLTVLTLDYVEPGRKANIREAIRYSRSQGFVPYVSTLKLDQVFYYTLGR
ncbi:MAG: endo alpha-1,4 polygalactosaminidase [Desulfovibrionaceae bacterium]